MDRTNFNFKMVCPVLLLLVIYYCEIIAAASRDEGRRHSAQPIMDDDQQQIVGELRESRRGNDRKLFYKCYEGQEERDGKGLKVCTGRYCVRIIHHQSGHNRLYCKNFTEDEDPHPGQCKEMSHDQMPGQTETMCSCTGDYCNRAPSNGGISTSFVLILVVSCLFALLLCSSLVGAVILAR